MVLGMGVFFLMSSQPVFMVGLLILITLAYSMYMYMLMGSYWFSYALVMVVLSGVMVVFMYMVSMFPNESFEIYNLVYVVFLMFMFFLKGFNVYGVDNSLISLNLWEFYVGVFNLFLVVFLLSIMLMVVWMSCIEKGAFRVV